MNTVFVLLIAIALAFILPQYKFSTLKNVCSIPFRGIITVVSNITHKGGRTNNFFSALLIICLFTLSFIIPTLAFFYTSKLSIILTFIIEIFCAYQLIAIPSFDSFLKHESSVVSENSTIIIQSIISFVDNFYVPCLCIALFGIPFAFLYRVFSYCTKKILNSNNTILHIIKKVHDVLYFIPSYSIVLSLFASSIFLPFCNSMNAYTVFISDKNKIEPKWLSRILSVSFGLLCVKIPVTFVSGNEIKTEIIGNTNQNISFENVKSLMYVLYCSSALILFVILLSRLIVNWGVW